MTTQRRWSQRARRLAAVVVAVTVVAATALGTNLAARGRAVAGPPPAHPDPSLLAGAHLVAGGLAGARVSAGPQFQAWLAAGTVPAPGTPYAALATSALTDLYSLTLANGGVIASLPTAWHYVWPRDSAFAAVAFAETGHLDDAVRALRFLQDVQAPDGSFQARYRTDGSGPPDRRGIQEDDPGWALWAVDEVVAAAPVDQRADVAAGLAPLVRRSLGRLLVRTAGGDALPGPSADYWEVGETQVTLGIAAPTLAGLLAGSRLVQDQDPGLAAEAARRAGVLRGTHRAVLRQLRLQPLPRRPGPGRGRDLRPPAVRRHPARRSGGRGPGRGDPAAPARRRRDPRRDLAPARRHLLDARDGAVPRGRGGDRRPRDRERQAVLVRRARTRRDAAGEGRRGRAPRRRRSAGLDRLAGADRPGRSSTSSHRGADPMGRILHAARPADWDAALARGRYDVSTLGRSLADEGFIHASTAAQLPGVLSAFYGELDEVVLLVLDGPALERSGAPVRWDDVPGAPGPFPHVYGEIPSSRCRRRPSGRRSDPGATRRRSRLGAAGPHAVRRPDRAGGLAAAGPRAPARRVPVPAVRDVEHPVGRPGHDVRDARRDLLLAARAAVALDRDAPVDRADEPLAVRVRLPSLDAGQGATDVQLLPGEVRSRSAADGRLAGPGCCAARLSRTSGTRARSCARGTPR